MSRRRASIRCVRPPARRREEQSFIVCAATRSPAFVGCCARAASGHAAAPPSNVMISRRLMLDIELPPALAPASSGFVLAAAAEPPLADGITRLLALPEELHIGHDRLIRMVG